MTGTHRCRRGSFFPTANLSEVSRKRAGSCRTILGGNGQIGLATASRIAEAGWTVTVAHRGQRGGRFSGTARVADVVGIDRQEPGALARALGSGADVLIDVIAYGRGHARQLLGVQGVVGALVVISSASVYRDEKGRTLDEASETGFPELPVPISERQPTVEPGPETYSTRKVLLERTLLDEAVVPLTILRPAAISGVGSTHAREWWFVKRVLDRRPIIPLAYCEICRKNTGSAFNFFAVWNSKNVTIVGETESWIHSTDHRRF